MSTAEPVLRRTLAQTWWGYRGMTLRRGQQGSADPPHMHLERVPGDAAIVDPDDARTGVGGELCGELIP